MMLNLEPIYDSLPAAAFSSNLPISTVLTKTVSRTAGTTGGIETVDGKHERAMGAVVTSDCERQ